MINWIINLFKKKEDYGSQFIRLPLIDGCVSYGQVITKYELEQRGKLNESYRKRHAAYLGVMKEPGYSVFERAWIDIRW